jgi:hypothetical protein
VKEKPKKKIVANVTKEGNAETYNKAVECSLRILFEETRLLLAVFLQRSFEKMCHGLVIA